MSVWVHQTCPRFFFFKPELYRDQPCCLSDTCPLALWQHPHVLHMNFSRRMVDGLPDGSLVDLEVTSFHGKRLQLSVTRGLNGWQLQQLILQKLSRPGRRLLLQHGAVPLKLQETLEQQGITGRRSNKNQLYYIYM